MLGMNILIGIVILALLLQIGLFFLIRSKKKELKSGVIERYNIKSPADAWRLINDLTIPEADRQEIERLYKGEQP